MTINLKGGKTLYETRFKRGRKKDCRESPKNPAKFMLYTLSTQERKFESVEFGVSSGKDVREASCARVCDATIYSRGLPNSSAVNSLSLGTTDRRLRCLTCGKAITDCPGHRGHIDLPLPVYQALFIDHTMKVLRSVCHECSEICMTSDEKDAVSEISDAKMRFASAYASARTKKRCPKCGALRPTFSRGVAGIKADFSNCASQTDEEAASLEAASALPFTALDARGTLAGIDKVESKRFFGAGFDAEELVTTDITLAAPCIRPAASSSDSSRTRGQDDITMRYQEIVKRAAELRVFLDKHKEYVFSDTCISSSAIDELVVASGADGCDAFDLFRNKEIEFQIDWRILETHPTVAAELLERWQRLQADVFAVVNPAAVKGGGLPTTSSSALVSSRAVSATAKSIVVRLKGKEGRFRNSLMGKRVNFSGRSVITPDPLIDVDELGVPISLAKVLTVAEVVTPTNIGTLRKAVLAGPDAILGAQTVIKSNGSVTSLAACERRDSVELRFGYVVERHLRDGDVVCFNRQPTLHRLGFNGHRVVLMPGLTFRLNLSMCGVYNADFDGDEMNVHVAQSSTASLEVRSLLAIDRNIISPQTNKPCFAIVQDSLVAAYKMTMSSVFIGEAAAFRILSQLKYVGRDALSNLARKTPAHASSATGGGEKMYSGAQLFSCILPRRLNIVAAGLCIRDGEIVSGRLSKKSLGCVSNGIIDTIAREPGLGGKKQAVRLLSEIQRLCNSWLLYETSFTIGAADCVVSEDAYKRIDASIEAAIRSVNAIRAASIPETMSGIAEAAMTTILNDLTLKNAGVVAKNAASGNGIIDCVESGSKGSPLNISQVVASVGQQIVCGKRIEGRLACFSHDDDSPEARGFIRSSFTTGLNAPEFFMAAMSGREGLVDTAVKTASSGYLQRCLVKTLEDLVVAYDGTVRNAQEQIVMLSCADGFDPCLVERVRVGHLLAEFSDAERATLHGDELAAVVSHRKRALAFLQQGHLHKMTEVVLLPVNVHRLLSMLSTSAAPSALEVPGCGSSTALLSASGVFAVVSHMMNSLKTEQLASKWDILFCYLHFELSFSRVSPYFSLQRQFDSFVDVIKNRILAAISPGGDSVGNTAALSLGEPSTQLTLNSFHTAGTSHTGVTLGVPRLKEIISCAKTMRTPQTTLWSHSDGSPLFEQMASGLCHKVVGSFVSGAKVIPFDVPRLSDYAEKDEEDGTFSKSVSERDERDLLDEIEFHLCVSSFFEDDDDQVQDCGGATVPSLPFLPCRFAIRLLLNKTSLRQYGATPHDIRTAILDKAHSASPLLSSIQLRVEASEEDSVRHWVFVVADRRDVLALAPPKTTTLSTKQLERAIHLRLLSLLKKVVVGGVSGISAAAVEKKTIWSPEKEAHEQKSVLQTRGSVLHLCHSLPGIDWRKCITNDISAIVSTLGIEAAHAVLFDEIFSILNNGSLDPRHVEVVVSAMTRPGSVMSLNRHGLNAQPTGPLTRAAFEETADILRDAAIFGEAEEIKSITANVLCGQPGRFGTGVFDVQRPVRRTGQSGSEGLSSGGGSLVKTSDGRGKVLATHLPGGSKDARKTERMFVARGVASFEHTRFWRPLSPTNQM